MELKCQQSLLLLMMKGWLLLLRMLTERLHHSVEASMNFKMLELHVKSNEHDIYLLLCAGGNKICRKILSIFINRSPHSREKNSTKCQNSYETA